MVEVNGGVPDKGPIINKTIAPRARLVIDGQCQKLGVK